MGEEFKKHLEHIKFEKYLNKLKKKLKDKKVIIYGVGSFFQYIKNNYDLSFLNIIGVSDAKFSLSEEGEEFLGYKIIPKEKITNYNPYCVLVATINYITIVEDFELNLLKNTKIKTYPIARIPLIDVIKEVWSR